MKTIKTISIVLLLSLLISLLSPLVSATAVQTKTSDSSKASSSDIDAEEENASASLKRTGVTNSCSYDYKKKEIRINGSVSHEVFVSHRDYVINLYKIDFSTSLDKELEKNTPLASTAISIKFNFVVGADSILDVLSQYVVVLVSPEGVAEFVGAELFPSVESEEASYSDRTLYKGIESTSASLSLQSAPSVAIVPVIVNKLSSAGHTGYLYTFENMNIFFDKQYIDQLDICVRNLSSLGTKIYFRLLFEDDGLSFGKDYFIPELYSEGVSGTLYAYCDFLASRYSSYKYGHISGMIIGKNLDDIKTTNYSAVDDADEYSELLARYGMTVALAIRDHLPYADIVYSFSNINSYGGASAASLTQILPTDIMENLCDYFDQYYSDDFIFSISVESSHTPLNISELSTGEYIDASSPSDDSYVTESNIGVISNYIEILEKKYKSFPKDFMYVWTPDDSLCGKALSCAYSYLYYKLFATDGLSSFVVSFSDENDSVYDVLNIIKHIDAQDGWYFTSPMLELFNKTSWAEIIPNFNREDYLQRYHKLCSPVSSLPLNIAGRFSYFDFAKSSDKTGWFAGSGTSSVEMYDSDVLGRVLSASMSFDTTNAGEYSSLFYSYEYCENFVYTPYVAVRLSIESEKKTSQMFELKISLTDSNNVYEFSQIVYTDEESYVYIDLLDFSKEYMADYIQFSLRPMGEYDESYKLLISSVEGVSTRYNNDELERLITAERLRIRDLALENESVEQGGLSVVIPIAVISIAGIIAIMLFFFLRREDSLEINEEDREE